MLSHFLSTNTVDFDIRGSYHTSMDLDSIISNFKSKSNYLTLQQGESFTGEYIKVEPYKDARYGDRLAFSFNIDGVEKILSRPHSGSSIAIVYQLKEINAQAGDTLKVTRLPNQGKAYSFKVEKVTHVDTAVENIFNP